MLKNDHKRSYFQISISLHRYTLSWDNYAERNMHITCHIAIIYNLVEFFLYIRYLFQILSTLKSLHKWSFPLSQQISANSLLFAKTDQSNKSETSAYVEMPSLFLDVPTLFFPEMRIKTVCKRSNFYWLKTSNRNGQIMENCF